MSISAVLFDMDGTLIDSESNYFLADRDFLALYGVEFTDELGAAMVGKGSVELLRWLKDSYDIPDPVEVLLEKKDSIYMEIARKGTTLYPEMKKLLDHFASAGIPMAIATGSSRKIADELLFSTDIRGYFSAVVCSEEVERGKPHPAVFIEAARLLGFHPRQCLVIEDSQYGVEAALASGAITVAIPTIITEPLHEPFLKADLLFPEGMRSFSASRLIEWMNTHHS